jgi:hypothetical protein
MRTRETTFAVAFALVAAASSAQTTGSLTLDSQPGDYIGGGQAWHHDSTNAAFSTSYDGSSLTVTIWPDDGGWWTVQLAAPPNEAIAIGAYENAVRASFRPPGSPGIDVTGMGRGCNQMHGRFEVTEATFGQNNYVEGFSATFEQHCEWAGAPALYGEIRVQNPPPPPALALGLEVSEALFNKVTGAANLHGTVACNRAADIQLGVTLTQRISRTEVVRGFSSLFVHCAAPGTAVELTIEPSAGSFVKGRPLEISANSSAYDPAYGTWVSATSVQVAKLK